jgi:hypothetical protein
VVETDFILEPGRFLKYTTRLGRIGPEVRSCRPGIYLGQVFLLLSDVKEKPSLLRGAPLIFRFLS